MGPTHELLAHEVEIMGFDGVTNGISYEPDFLPRMISGPGQIHIFSHGSQ
jgi:hypothetical protein